jgi:hypothetical protein
MISCVEDGGILATIESQEAQKAVHGLAGTGTWIGLSDIQGEGDFFWADGSSINYTNWRRNQPNNAKMNQHCVLIRPDWRWDDVKCSRVIPFACQKNLRVE